MTTMQRCLSQDELVLHYYGEMGAAGESAATAHLGECAACRTAFARLQEVLGAVDESLFAPPDLPDHFERTVWARLEPALEPARGRWRMQFLSPAPLALAAAVVLLVTAAFFAGRSLPRQAPDGGAPIAREQVRERILLIDLGEHLERAQAVLVELVSADPEAPLALAGERERAGQLVAANRLYRLTATATGDTAVAALLDELERVLVDVAARPDDAAPAALEDVRRRIEARSLLFRVRAVSSDVRERQQEAIRQLSEQTS